MRLTLSTLPQLAVLAKILCLLMVVMCGAVPSTVRSVSLYATCSRGNVTVMKQVRSMKQNDHNAPYQRLLTEFGGYELSASSNPLIKVYIYAEEAGKYICFNKRGRAVAKKKKDEMCLFLETYYGRYLRYVSAVDPTRYLGFNKFGKSLMWPRGNAKCYNFLPYHLSNAVKKSPFKSSKASTSHKPQLRSALANHRKPLQRSSNSLVHHQERTRHRHGWRRRQHLRQQQHQLQQQQQQHAMRPYQESKY